jgi:glycosyltransferase involved in cell wall biosynthesis
MPVRVTQAKNIELALAVTAALQESVARPALVITGPPDPHDAENMRYFERLLGLRQELGIAAQAHFVYESGPQPGEAYTIEAQVVGDLFRFCDALFMPSHREGFGIPVLEAGLAGVPVFCTAIPAAEEIGLPDVTLIDPSDPPVRIAMRIGRLVEQNPLSRFRRRVRADYTWEAIFERRIRPLLEAEAGREKAR